MGELLIFCVLVFTAGIVYRVHQRLEDVTVLLDAILEDARGRTDRELGR